MISYLLVSIITYSTCFLKFKFYFSFLSNHSICSSHECSYLAPEYVKDKRLTDKSDVFSFGVVLLELITGKQAVEKEGKVPINLAIWVLSSAVHFCYSSTLKIFLQTYIFESLAYSDSQEIVTESIDYKFIKYEGYNQLYLIRTCNDNGIE